jgi:hypothetical protein
VIKYFADPVIVRRGFFLASALGIISIRTDPAQIMDGAQEFVVVKQSSAPDIKGGATPKKNGPDVEAVFLRGA